MILRRTLSALATLTTLPALLLGQSPAGAPEASLPLKHINITSRIWFALGGQQRVRAERDVNYLGGGTDTRDDNFVLSRTQFSLELHINPTTRVFAEGRHVTARGRDLPGGTRASDRDDLDWATLYFEKSAGMGETRSTLRAGLIELSLGRERLISPSDWSNTRRTFEGVVLNSVGVKNTLTGFYANPVTVSQTARNRRNANASVWGVQSAWRRADSAAVLEVYVLNKDANETETTARADRTVLGTRVVTPIPGTKWVAEVEGGVQFGTADTSDVRAFMVATDFTYTFATRWSPSLTMGADWSSGTKAGRPAQSGTWDVIFPLGHSYTGYADVNGRRNLIEYRAALQASPRESVRLRASAHAFRRASGADAVYDDGGGVFRASVPGAPRDIGTEIDVSAQWRASRFFRFDAGGSVYSPGGFMRATGAAERYTWGFVSVTATY